VNKIKIKNKKTNYIILIIALFSLLFLANYVFALTCKCKTCSGVSGCNNENFYDDECPCSNECATPDECGGDDDPPDDDDPECTCRQCVNGICHKVEFEKKSDCPCTIDCCAFSDGSCANIGTQGCLIGGCNGDECMQCKSSGSWGTGTWDGYCGEVYCGEEPVGFVCGDGNCDSPDETKDNCCEDCGCPDGYTCVDNACVADVASCDGTDISCGSSEPCTNCNNNDGWYDSGSSYACCDGNSACTTCQKQKYRNYYCSGTSCTYTVTSTRTVKSGCTDCTGDGGYNVGSTYPCCDLTNPDIACTCQDQEYRDYYCSGTSCTYSKTSDQTLWSNCNNCGYCKTCSGGACIDKPGVKGIVTNASEPPEPIKNAEVNILGLDKFYTTDESGNYFICEFLSGTYDIVASKKGFNSVNKQFTFDGNNMVTRDFVLYTAGSDCRQDCSKTTDEENLRCHADCDGINGCKFFDERTKEICTIPLNRVVGVIESYNATHKLRCCIGEPYLHKKISGDRLVFPESENIVRITRIVFWRGQFVKMIIDVFK